MIKYSNRNFFKFLNSNLMIFINNMTLSHEGLDTIAPYLITLSQRIYSSFLEAHMLFILLSDFFFTRSHAHIAMTLGISLKELSIGIASACTTSDNYFRRFSHLFKNHLLPLNSTRNKFLKNHIYLSNKTLSLMWCYNRTSNQLIGTTNKVTHCPLLLGSSFIFSLRT